MLKSDNNQAMLLGRLDGAPNYDHRLHGETFYRLSILVRRLSGNEDSLPATVSGRLLSTMEMYNGMPIRATGQLRSYSFRLPDGHAKLMVSLFAQQIEEASPEEEHVNRVTLVGELMKQPVYRMTPLKREIADILIKVERAYGKTDVIPCIAWGRNARFCERLKIGDHLSVGGRLQSRGYQKQLINGSIEERVAYEMSISEMEELL